MRKLLKTMKMLLLIAAGLCVGASAWANDTFGSLEEGYAVGSQTYTLSGYGTFEFDFTTTNSTSKSNDYENWVLLVSGSDNTEYFNCWGAQYAHQNNHAVNSNANPTQIYAGSTFASVNTGEGMTIRKAMNGASVHMTITRWSGNIKVFSEVTPTAEGYSPFTLTHQYLKGDATAANLQLKFATEYATMDISSASQTYSTAWQDLFDDAGTYSAGWSLKGSRGNGWSYTQSQNTRSGDYKYYNISNRGYNTMATYAFDGISAITSATDYVFDMDYAMTLCKNNGTTSMIIYDNAETPNEIFKISLAGKDNGSGSTTLEQGAIYINGSSTAESQTFTMNTFRGGTLTWYNIHITSNSTDGTDLTLTKYGDATETTTFHISDELVTLGKIYQDNCGANSNYFGGGSFDNFVLQTPADETSISEPTVNITDFDLTSRTIELSTLTDGATIYYSETSSDPEESSAWSEYTGAFATTATPIYAYAKKGDYSSTVATLATGAGTAFTLNTPSIMRTGATTYRVTASATSALGVTATQTIHYTVNGGAEKTADSSPADINDVNGDVVVWTTADKFGSSAEVQATYVKAYDLASEPTWAYNLNSYPSAHSCTNINDALSTMGKDIQGTTMYNLKEESYPNLYVENATGWYLRNQASNAFKCQSARTSIGFDNVTTTDVIYVQVSNDDASKNSIYSVSNGTVKYNYSLGKFYIVPTEDGSVKVTFQTGSSVQTVGVYCQVVPVTTTANGKGWATLYTDKALDFSGVEGLTAYTAMVSDNTVTLNAVESIPANTGVVLKSSTTDADATYSIPVAKSSTTPQGDMKGSTTEAKAASEQAPIYILKLNANNEAQFMCATYGSLAAGKAYLEIGNTLAKALTVVFANDPTGIATVNAAETVQPVKRIVNGQLVIEKNGKRYNAAGAEL